ncbi:hypothetical protein AA18890_0770 [Komagataeibacter europaeus LMG 18890]|nr:hypothetical protein AA18890_0770 [Komagataeibacter europaeus LMG 18890]
MHKPPLRLPQPGLPNPVRLPLRQRLLRLRRRRLPHPPMRPPLPPHQSVIHRLVKPGAYW